MKNQKTFASKLASFVQKYRWAVLIGSLLIGLGIGSGASKLKFDGDYHAYFSESNPQLEAFDALQEKYTKDESVIIALSPENENLFTNDNLAAIENMTADAWKIPFNSRVDAITNFQHTQAVEDDLYVADLVEDAKALTSSEIEAVKKVALNDPLLVNRIINEAGSVTAININIKLPGKSDKEQIEVMAAVREMVEKWEMAYPDFDYHITGIVPINSAFFESAMGDNMTLIPGMFLMVLVIIAFLTRSISATISTLAIIILSIITAAGFAGFAGIFLTPASAQFSPIILTLAVADSIHVLITIINKMKAGYNKKEAISESLRLNFIPVTITSLTTIVGFLSMNFGDVPPYKDLGNITAVGMLAACIFSLTTLPAMIYLLPFKVKPVENYVANKTIYEKIGFWVAQKPKAVAMAVSTFIIVMGFFAVQNQLNDQFTKYFHKSITFRSDSDYIKDNLTSMHQVEYSMSLS